MVTIRVLQRVVARTAIDDHPLFEGEEFLARELTVFEHHLWEPYYGRALPRGYQAPTVFGTAGESPRARPSSSASKEFTGR